FSRDWSSDVCSSDLIYVCGSNRLMLAAQRVARRLGLFGEVALEQQMACGIGMCFCCVRPFREGEGIVHRRVCCEGPVFPLQEAKIGRASCREREWVW